MAARLLLIAVAFAIVTSRKRASQISMRANGYLFLSREIRKYALEIT